MRISVWSSDVCSSDLVPQANVGWTETAMRQYAQADVAVAVSTDTGLITPIVRAADRKTLSQISAEIADLAARPRAGQLRPAESQGGSFSVSHVGMHGEIGRASCRERVCQSV